MGMMAYSSNERKMVMNNAKLKNDLDGVEFGSRSGPLLILGLPDSRILRVMSRSLLVIMFLFSLPSIGSMMSDSSDISDESNVGYLVENGILTKGQKGLLVASSGLEKKMPLPGRRSLSGIIPQAKKEALLGLEDVMLEPPSEKLKKSNKISRKMKFLPDLLKDSLQNYPRRIFVSDGDKGVSQWFKKNYPTKGQEFEMFDMEVKENEAGNGKPSMISRVGMLSDWLRNHVKEHDYVVMKAEATLVEEMLKDNTTCLVDELLLECESQWGEDEENGEEKDSSKRSYWQCLSLYGRLRDEGVAVHQWWS